MGWSLLYFKKWFQIIVLILMDTCKVKHYMLVVTWKLMIFLTNRYALGPWAYICIMQMPYAYVTTIIHTYESIINRYSICMYLLNCVLSLVHDVVHPVYILVVLNVKWHNTNELYIILSMVTHWKCTVNLFCQKC